MSFIAAIAGLGVAIATQGQAEVIGFTGPYAPGTWTVATTGTLLGGGSPGSALFTPTTLTITGGNDSIGCDGGVYGNLTSPCRISVITTNIMDPFSFHWAYHTDDADGPPGDVFGVVVDGVRIALSNQAGAIDQAGDATISAFSSFGWFVTCTDCIGGTATATISAFIAGVPSGVPEPATLALLGLSLAGLGFSRRKH